ncbi:dienelactone hydrolase family protein [Sphingobium sp. HBC34]|uniref:Dienelactone hydrolase family protein n=1 Tax=Sphingobium cyanobacteriorum TaxID=3063954 RepID=A0ABT8ZGQ9_9SPHN|nr:dienelactone hydrolase family protein [Sphingobium sp. HBC34]MDO7833735.1 dienelactone hydrolase family protein [Sphingobium sp. HBC34]
MIRRHHYRVAASVFGLLVGIPQVAVAQATGTASPAFSFAQVPTPPKAGEIPLQTGPQAPEMPAENWFRMNGDLNVRNVSVATLTPFLPDPDKATGTAIIVAPGGGFLGLAMETEGYAVARWLADHGIAAFVLKYRLVPTPDDFNVYTQEMKDAMGGKPSGMRPPQDTPTFSRDDGLAALALVRARAKEWRVDSARIGMMGFSAGAFTTITATLAARPGERPAFIAPIYGRLTAHDVPADAPPMFAVLAADDHAFANQGFGLINGWVRAKRPVEFHFYQNGGHGFGLGRAGTTSNGWIETFMAWLANNGLTGKH